MAELVAATLVLALSRHMSAVHKDPDSESAPPSPALVGDCGAGAGIVAERDTLAAAVGVAFRVGKNVGGGREVATEKEDSEARLVSRAASRVGGAKEFGRGSVAHLR